MASLSTEIVHDLFPLLRVYKDGRLERLLGNDIVPASVDPATGVQSKDVEIAPETGVSARLYIPKTTHKTTKLPLLVYFHGGGFVVETAFSPTYHNYLNSLVAEANVVAVSVDYRRAPEHFLPAAFEDAWAAIQWVASHSAGGGPDPWLNDYVDFQRLFFAGDSAGSNLAHHMALRVGSEGSDGIKVVGIVLYHPFFWGEEAIDGKDVDVKWKEIVEKLWFFAYPTTSGLDDPLFNPVADPNLVSLGCDKVLVCVAEKDALRDRGWYYYEVLGKSGWGGEAEIMEAKGEEHVFHLFNHTCENAVALQKRVVSFLN